MKLCGIRVKQIVITRPKPISNPWPWSYVGSVL